MANASPNPSDRLHLTVRPILPAYEQIADQLRTLVIRGELRPGERLPAEAEIATMFGVGRTTVREALRLLASQGLVTTRRGAGGGTFIVSPDRDAISQYLEVSLGLLVGSHRPAVEDLLEARLALEKPAARLAALRHDRDQLAEISATIPEGSAPNVDMYQSKFHEAVLGASGNTMLKVMTRPVFDVLRTRLMRSAASPEFWERVVVEHRQILEAIARRDGEGAEKSMHDHLTHLSSVYRDIDTALRRDLRPAAELALAAGIAPQHEKLEHLGGD